MTLSETYLANKARDKARWYKEATEFRIVKLYIFDGWYYKLQERRSFWFFGTRHYWANYHLEDVVHLVKYVPVAWREMNIIEEITEPKK